MKFSVAALVASLSASLVSAVAIDQRASTPLAKVYSSCKNSKQVGGVFDPRRDDADDGTLLLGCFDV